MQKIIAVLSISSILLLAGCGYSTSDRAVSGAGLGAGVGAIGGAVAGGSVVGGALVGGAAGAAAGALIPEKNLDLNK